MKQTDNKITAAEGKVLKRISDGWIAGKEITLGRTFYLGGELLEKPIEELPEHYQEIDKPLIDEETPIIASEDEVIAEIIEEPEEMMEKLDEPSEPIVIDIETKQPVVITAGDIVSLQEKVDKLISVLTPIQKEELGLTE